MLFEKTISVVNIYICMTDDSTFHIFWIYLNLKLDRYKIKAGKMENPKATLLLTTGDEGGFANESQATDLPRPSIVECL